VVAIGGINESNLAEVMKTETDFIALVTAITEAIDPEAATRRLLKAMNAPQNSAAFSE
jgi:thiamine monophosphate synthase